MKNVIISSLLMINFALASVNELDNGLDVRDFSLKLCLNTNYRNYGVNPNILNDASALNNKYGPDDWRKINEFVMKNTSHFYKDNIYLHLEESGDRTMNIIFSKCMKFYHSKNLNDFLRKNKYL